MMAKSSGVQLQIRTKVKYLEEQQMTSVYTVSVVMYTLLKTLYLSKVILRSVKSFQKFLQRI